MNILYKTLILVMSFLVVFLACPVKAQEQTSSPDDWEIRLMPYFWMISVDADATVSGLSGSVDLSFGDVFDYLDCGAMGRMEAWKGKWGFTFDGVYMNLGADGSFEGTRGVTRFDLDVDARLGMADFGLAYRIFEQPFGNNNEQRLTLEPYGGLRYAYLRQKIDLEATIPEVGSQGATLGGSEDWVEPLIGGRIRWDLNDTWAFSFRGDAGGFGIGSASDLMWQLEGSVVFRLTDNISLNAGYRMADLDYSRHSGSNEFGVDLQAKGPFLGMTIIF
jgi:hypothetical protein